MYTVHTFSAQVLGQLPGSTHQSAPSIGGEAPQSHNPTIDTTMDIDTNPVGSGEAEHVDTGMCDQCQLLRHFKASLGGQKVFVIYHGGCPDGCLAAYILHHALQTYCEPSQIYMCPTTHNKRNGDVLEDDCIAFFVDVGPTSEDLDKLRLCWMAIVLDHHAGKKDIMSELMALLPDSLWDLSDYDGVECGATLVAKFCESRAVPEWIMHLFHHNDVHEHELPKDVHQHREAFQGFMTQHGLGMCTVALVQEFLTHPSEALEKGSRIYSTTASYTRTVFEQRQLLKDTPKGSIFVVDLGSNPAGIDLELYQALIDGLASNKPVVFTTLNRRKLPDGIWIVGLRRAGEHPDMEFVSKRLGLCSSLGFKTGGGHPYAAGAQCEEDIPAQAIADQIAVICEFGP